MITADFLWETMHVRRRWNDIFKVVKQKHFQPIILRPEKNIYQKESD